MIVALMMVSDWAVVVLYAIATIGLGRAAPRGGRAADDYFVAGRNLGGFLAGISLFATLLSTITYLGLPGEVVAHGTGFLWQIAVFPLLYLIIGYLFIPHIMAQPVNSAYELLEMRLGRQIRQLAAGVFLVLRLFWMALILFTCSNALAVIVGVRSEWLMAGMAFVTLLYTAEGGIRAVIWTDVAQFFILFGGAVGILFYITATSNLGFPELIRESWSSAAIPAITFDPQVRMSIVGLMTWTGLWWIATCGSDQVAMQRFFTNRDARVARRTLLVNLTANALTLAAMAAVGLALLHYVRARPESLPAEMRDLAAKGDQLFPYFIGHMLPEGLRGLIIAAILAAAMSSLSSGMNSIATVLTVDFFRIGDRRPERERALARTTSIVVTLLSVGLALLLPAVGGNFFELAGRVLDPFSGPLFGLFALAFFDCRANGRSAAIGFGIGLAVAFGLAHGHRLIPQASSWSFLLIMPGSIAATVGSAWLAARWHPVAATR